MMPCVCRPFIQALQITIHILLLEIFLIRSLSFKRSLFRSLNIYKRKRRSILYHIIWNYNKCNLYKEISRHTTPLCMGQYVSFFDPYIIGLIDSSCLSVYRTFLYMPPYAWRSVSDGFIMLNSWLRRLVLYSLVFEYYLLFCSKSEVILSVAPRRLCTRVTTDQEHPSQYITVLMIRTPQ